MINIRKVSVLFEPRDLWIGIYWKHEIPYHLIPTYHSLSIYVCIIPMLPIIIEMWWGTVPNDF